MQLPRDADANLDSFINVILHADVDSLADAVSLSYVNDHTFAHGNTDRDCHFHAEPNCDADAERLQHGSCD